MNHDSPDCDRSSENMSEPEFNKFIYVKKDFPTPKFTVLINPNFRRTVYINPKFQDNNNRTTSSGSNDCYQPCSKEIYVNPKMFPSVCSSVPPEITVPENVPAKPLTVETVVIKSPPPKMPPQSTPLIVLRSKYKLIKRFTNNNNNKQKSPVNNTVTVVRTNKYRIDNRHSKASLKATSSLIQRKKKFIFANTAALLKTAFWRHNKKTSKASFINVSGRIFRRTSYSLRQTKSCNISITAADTPIKPQNTIQTAFKFVKGNTTPKTSPKSVTTSNRKRRSLVKRFKIIRSKKVEISNSSKMKKCNIPCPLYRKYGKCVHHEKGKCALYHNPNHITLCAKFLQGACVSETCLLSHNVSAEKMPTCKYYLEGLCTRDICPYLHVKISPKADICKEFLDGFCKLGIQCNKRHQYLCPEYEKHQSCSKRKCPYPHGSNVSKVTLKPVVKKKTVKRHSKKSKHIKQFAAIKSTEVNEEKIRYYNKRKSGIGAKSSNACNETDDSTTVRRGSKLEKLPAFIPLNNSS